MGSINIFDDLFEPQIIERGIGYYYNDMVKDIKNDDHTYSAKITGTRVYDVKIKFNSTEDKILEAECNCPYSVDREKYCKHIYALLYDLKGDKLDRSIINKSTYNYNIPPKIEVININCPNCGANLTVYSPKENIECTYCNSTFALDIRLTGQARKLEEIIEQAELYYKAEDFSEAFYEYAKALYLDKNNKYLKYYMDLSGKLKNLDNYIGLDSYKDLYNEFKEVYNEEKNEDTKFSLCVSFCNLLVRHANKHINHEYLSGEYFWEELETIIGYYNRIIEELELSNKTKAFIYDKHVNALEIEIQKYEYYKSKTNNSMFSLKLKLKNMKKQRDIYKKYLEL